MDNIRTHLIIEGRVQGVFFRDTTRREAVGLGLRGWVKNRLDGSVEVIVEGPKGKVDQLVQWCQHGPSYAQVTGVNRIDEEFTGEFDAFRIVF
jgi:acylphosphatase